MKLDIYGTSSSGEVVQHLDDLYHEAASARRRREDRGRMTP
jgi:hypothetical protein